MGDSSNKSENIWKKGVAHVIDLLSSLFLPFINLMVSVGILKGILVLMVANGIVTDGTATYDILNAMSDAFFYFIPLFLAYTAAKKFDVEPFSAILVACILLHPSMTTVMATEGTATFFGIPLKTVTPHVSFLPDIFLKRSFHGFISPPFCFCNSHSSGYLLYEFCSEVLL